ncbi:MAG TPA: DUF3597 domain-containing protein [Acetobacteraceae bacterium]|jgi:3-oxoacyl-ACP reductase-like protein
MSIFGSILSKILQTGAAAQPAADAAPAPASAGAPAAAAPAPAPAAPPASAPAASAAVPAQPVDVEAVLTAMAAPKGGGGNWRTSIVDLLKLLDLDSSLAARKELGGELNVHAGADGSAEQNVALHKAVMHKLAENGGKVPESLRG